MIGFEVEKLGLKDFIQARLGLSVLNQEVKILSC